jgi:hypothetical protein
VHGGDLLRIDFDSSQTRLIFTKEAEDMPAYAMAQMIETAPSPKAAAATASLVPFEQQRVANARSSKRA